MRCARFALPSIDEDRTLSLQLNLRRRRLAIVLSAAAHMAVLVLILRTPVPAAVDEGRTAMTVSFVSGLDLGSQSHAAPPSFPARKREPSHPIDIPPHFVEVAPVAPTADTTNDAVANSVSAAAAGSVGQPCQLAAWLQQALQHDPAVNLALMDIPRPARSVANAMMLWDGAWVPPPGSSRAGFARVRAAIISGVRAAPAPCLTQDVAGPELMTLTVGVDTTVIVVGSGVWRWGDLLTSQSAGSSAAAAL